CMSPPPPTRSFFPSTTLFRSHRAAALIGDANIFEAKFLRGRDHFLEGIVSVAGGSMAMKGAAQVLQLDQARQFSRLCRFEFAAIFAQLRRNEIESESAIETRFFVNFRNGRDD